MIITLPLENLLTTRLGFVAGRLSQSLADFADQSAHPARLSTPEPAQTLGAEFSLDPAEDPERWDGLS